MNTRQIAHRKLTQAIKGFETYSLTIFEVATVYDEMHPEVSTPLFTSIEFIDEVIKLISKVKDSI